MASHAKKVEARHEVDPAGANSGTEDGSSAQNRLSHFFGQEGTGFEKKSLDSTFKTNQTSPNFI